MPTATPAATHDEPISHPGFEWIQEAACAQGDAGDEAFFVEAGRVIDSDVLKMCRACPVRRECVTHSYLGGPGETMIGAGYFGGFSLGQRKAMTLRQALARVDAEAQEDAARATPPNS